MARNIQFIPCTLTEHGARIQEIYNKAILESGALYEHIPYTDNDIQEWFAKRQTHGFPVIGAVDAGTLLGFATYDFFREQTGYNRTVEHSIYIHHEARGDGLGGALLRKLVEAAAQQRLHSLIGVIDAENQASITLHENLGFQFAGTLREAGHKFGKWRDVSFFQRILPGSQTPPGPIAPNR